MCQSRYMNLTCVLAKESLARPCAGFLILKPDCFCWNEIEGPPVELYQAPYITHELPLMAPMWHLCHAPLSSFTRVFVDTNMQNATSFFQYPYMWHTKIWGTLDPMGWNLTNERLLLAGKFWCLPLSGWAVWRGSIFLWLLSNNSNVFLVSPSLIYSY